MLLAELIVRARCHIRAAELAVRTGADANVITELSQLRELLNDQPQLEASGALEEATAELPFEQ